MQGESYENCDGSDLAKDACRKLWDEFSDQINIICRKSYEKQQSKVDELQYKAKLRESDHQALLVKYQATKKCWEDMSKEKDELQKRVDAVKGLAQILWEKSEEKHQQGKVWESKTLGECADEILDVLEQALKGGGSEI